MRASTSDSVRIVTGLLRGRMPARLRTSLCGRAATAVLLGGLCSANATAANPPDLTGLSLEDLLDVQVTGVSKKPERRFNSAAAVYVLTSEDIRRSGATTIPDLLRLVPGVQVERIDANKWAVGVRGFASRLSRSLLVLIDGRSVYSPLFAGVYWEVQDTLLEDIERIEVILGPGGSLWGANAVNGVINIITRDARNTTGGVSLVRTGTEEPAFASVRYGAKTDDSNTGWRVYGKVFDRDALYHGDGNNYDDWRMARGGFRMDTRGDKVDLMVQGDAYAGHSGQNTLITLLSAPYQRTARESAALSGADVLARWSSGGERSKWQIQTYYDHTSRDEPQFRDVRDTFDIDMQDHRLFGERHELTYGLGYRIYRGTTTSVPTISFVPETRNEQVASAFAEVDFALTPETVHLIMGSKFENNDYSGFEWQPNLRVSWLASPRTLLWMSAARAVRTPSRIERDLTLISVVDPQTPAFARVTGDEGFESEKVLAYEFGQRMQLSTATSLELSLFYNQYRDFLSLERGAPFIGTTADGAEAVFLPLVIANGMRVNTRGGELSMQWRPQQAVRLSGHYAYLDIEARPVAGSTDTTSTRSVEGGSPQHTAAFRAGWSPRPHIDIDVMLRYVSRLAGLGVPDYVTADMRFSYWFSKTVEFMLAGRDLTESHHAEFATAGAAVDVQRSAYTALKWYW